MMLLSAVFPALALDRLLPDKASFKLMTQTMATDALPWNASTKGHKKILLYSYPGKEMFYKSLGFKRMSTAMVIFENQNQALEWDLVNET